MRRVKSLVHSLFSKHLFLTNVISCGGLLAIGDGFIQNLERIHHRRLTGEKRSFDFHRTGRMFVVGLCLGPFNHHWYRLLDKIIIGSGMKVVVKKIAADQAVAGPFFSSAFLIGSGILEGKTIKDCGDEWREKFLTIYMADWCVWPLAQSFNFYFLPSHYRVFYVSIITLCWNTFLSFMKHRELHHSNVHHPLHVPPVQHYLEECKDEE